MCRSIKQLRFSDRTPSDDELQAAALQFVRKVSGYRVPSKVNDDSFNLAVVEIAASTRRLINNLAPPRVTARRSPDLNRQLPSQPAAQPKTKHRNPLIAGNRKD